MYFRTLELASFALPKKRGQSIRFAASIFFNYHFYHLPKSVQSFDSCVTRSTAIEMTSLKLVSWLGVNFSSSSLELEFDVSFARILSLVVLRSYFSAQFRFDLLIELTLGQMKHSRQNTGQVWLESINYAASVSQTVGGNGLIHSNYDRLEMWYKFKELHFFLSSWWFPVVHRTAIYNIGIRFEWNNLLNWDRISLKALANRLIQLVKFYLPIVGA